MIVSLGLSHSPKMLIQKWILCPVSLGQQQSSLCAGHGGNQRHIADPPLLSQGHRWKLAHCTEVWKGFPFLGLSSARVPISPGLLPPLLVPTAGPGVSMLDQWHVSLQQLSIVNSATLTVAETQQPSFVQELRGGVQSRSSRT